MTASNDSIHSDISPDRRQRFRIDDTAILEVVAVSNDALDNATIESFFTPSTTFNLIRELRAIEQENHGVLRLIADSDNDVATYLSAVDKNRRRGQCGGRGILPEGHQLQSIDLSEGGIGFNYNEKMAENNCYAMKIWFHRALLGVSAFIRVVACNRAIDGGYHISAAFHQLPEGEQKTIARHIMAVQAERQRLKKAEDWTVQQLNRMGNCVWSG